MSNRGRPPVTRARAFHWLDAHYPCTQGTFVRALELERSYARRLWRQWLAEKYIAVEFNPVLKVLKAA